MKNWPVEYRRICKILSIYGWFPPSYMIGSDLNRISMVVDLIEKNPAGNISERKEYEKHIHYTMLDICYHPNFRTRLIWHGLKVPHFKDYSHIVEMATFSFYKKNYAASISLNLIALEGILRSFCLEDNPSLLQIKNSIKDVLILESYEGAGESHKIYRDMLYDFLNDWVYIKTDKADFSLSVLNRHYILHGINSGDFYRPQDACRIILSMDLLLDFLSYSTETWEPCFLPDNGVDAKFDIRRDYYASLSEGKITLKESWHTERRLLTEHEKYVAPKVDEPNSMLEAYILGKYIK